jgi:hypothetical protein
MLRLPPLLHCRVPTNVPISDILTLSQKLIYFHLWKEHTTLLIGRQAWGARRSSSRTVLIVITIVKFRRAPVITTSILLALSRLDSQSLTRYACDYPPLTKPAYLHNTQL